MLRRERCGATAGKGAKGVRYCFLVSGCFVPGMQALPRRRVSPRVHSAVALLFRRTCMGVIMATARALAVVTAQAAHTIQVQASGEHTIAVLKALAQPARLAIFRMVNAAPDGLAARVIAARVGGPHSVVSMHLAILSRARLITGRRTAGIVTYRSNPVAVQAFIEYLLADGVQGGVPTGTESPR